MPPVRLHSFDEVLRTLDSLPADLKPGAGHGLMHCAHSVGYSLRGYPALKPALFRATIGRFVKWLFLRRGYMSHNTDDGTPGAPEIPRDTTVADAVAALRAAIADFRKHGGELKPHVVYGPCTREEYEKIHSMHIANHLDAVMAG